MLAVVIERCVIGDYVCDDVCVIDDGVCVIGAGVCVIGDDVCLLYVRVFDDDVRIFVLGTVFRET